MKYKEIEIIKKSNFSLRGWDIMPFNVLGINNFIHLRYYPHTNIL